MYNNTLTGPIPEGWQLPDGLQVHLGAHPTHLLSLLCCVFDLSQGMPLRGRSCWTLEICVQPHCWHITLKAVLALAWLGLAPPSPLFVGILRVGHDSSASLLAAQKLDLDNNQLSGTIPDGWRLPSSVQVQGGQCVPSIACCKYYA